MREVIEGVKAETDYPWKAAILFTIAYSAAVVIGNLFLFSPGNVSIFWPAAAVSLAGLLVGGLRLWPCIALGDLLLVFLSVYGGVDLLSEEGASLLETMGAVLQAVVGAAYIKRHLGAVLEGDRRAIAKVYLFGVLLCCAISPTIGVAGMWLQGVIVQAEILSTWFSWWVGDSTPIILFIPVIVVVAYQNKRAEKVKYHLLLPPVFLASAVAIVGTLWFHADEEYSAQAELTLRSQSAFELLTERLAAATGAVESTEYFINAQDVLTEDSLERYASRMNITGLEAIAWFPRVAHEDLQKQQVISGFDAINNRGITSFNGRNEVIAAPQSHEYFPMVYSSFKKFGGAYLGFDLASLSLYKSEIEQVRDTGQGAFSASFSLRQSDETVLTYYQPVYENGVDAVPATVEGRRARLKGFLVGLVNPTLLSSNLDDSRSPSGLAYSLTATTPAGEDFSLFSGTNPDQKQSLVYSATYAPNGLVFEWSAHADSDYWIANDSSKSRLFRLGMLSSVLMFSLIVLNAINRNRSISKQVVLRTGQLEQEREKLKQALDIAYVYNWTMSVEDRVITMDDRSYDLLETTAAAEGGYKLSLSRWMKDFLHPDDVQILQRLIAKKWPSDPEQSKECEGRLVSRKGNVRHVFFRFNARYDSQGRIVSVLGTTQDITARKAMTVALRESEEYSRSILGSSQDCIKILDLDGRILDITDRGIALLCIPDIEKVRNKAWITFWNREQDRKSVMAAIQSAHAGGTGRFQGFTPSMDGAEKWWDVVVTPILGIDGKPERLLVVSRDISIEREAQLALEKLNAHLEDEVNSRSTQLKESEKQLRATVDNAAVGIIHVDAEGIIIRSNPKFREISGFRYSELAKLNVRNLLHVEDLQLFEQLCTNGDKPANSSFKKEVQFVNKEGEARWLRLTGSAVHNEVGALQYRVVLVEDIHEHRQIEQALIGSEKRYRNMFESNPVPMWSFDAETLQFTSVNKAAIEHYGYSESEFLTMTILDIRPEQERGKIKAHIQSRKENSYSRMEDVLHMRKDGSIIHVDTTSHELKDSETKMRIVLATDITDRKKAAVELHQQQEMTRLLLENLAEGVIACDKNGQLIMFNKAAREWHGTDPRDIPPEQWSEYYDLFQANGKTAVAMADIPLMRAFNGEMVRSAEMSICKKGGETRYVLASGGPLIDSNGEKQGAVVVMHDITERNRADRALEQSARQLEAANAEVEDERAKLAERVIQRTAELTMANEKLQLAKADAEAASRAKSAFLAVMSHEIRTPMNGIVGMVDVLSHSKLDEQHAGSIRTIKDSAFSLLGIIDDILDFSKIEASRMELERCHLDLSAKVENVVGSLAAMAHNKGVALDLYVDPGLPRVIWGDPTRLRQVVTNLIGNAIKFSSGRANVSGAVKISVDRVTDAENSLVIKVIDNGIGIASEQIPKLFTSFNQAETSTTRMFGGTGLGLAISKRLVELMGGDITVVSEPGNGATFSVTLPMEVVEGSANDEMQDLLGVNCIFVDAEGGESSELCAYLEHAGASVLQQESLQGAVQLSRSVDTDTVTIVNVTGLESPSETELEDLVAGYKSNSFVLLNRGKQCLPRVIRPGLVRLDGNFSRRPELLEAVAIAAGKASAAGSEYVEEILSTNAVAAPSIAAAREAGQLILIAEDDKTNQKVLLLQLGMLGFAAEIAIDGAEAWRMWQTGSYACVLTDLHMPNMDGYDLTKNIRAAEQAGQRVPILMLTANALNGEGEKAKLLGVDAYLTKPLQLTVLHDAMRKWMPKVASPVVVDDASKTPSANPPIAKVDIAVLASIVGVEREIQDEVLEDYLESAAQIDAELNQASENGDAEKIGALAHRLKGASRTIGAMTLGDLCGELENAGRSDDLVVVQSCLEAMKPELREVVVQVRKHLGEWRSPTPSTMALH